MGKIEKDDPVARDRFLKSYYQGNNADWSYNKGSCLVILIVWLLSLAAIISVIGIYA